MRNNPLPDKKRLEHILEAIHQIDTFTKGMDKEMFLDDPVIQSAVLYQFAVIGEAVAKTNRDILDKYPYPWHYVRSFRNFILHEYHAIEIRVVWDTIQNDLPGLKKIVETILIKEFPGEEID